MRILLTGLLAAGLAALDAPSLVRPDGAATAAMDYDLAATAPWMPLFWDRLALALPASAAATRIECVFATSNGFIADGSDLLTLRDGHLLTLGVGTLLVDGVAGTWNGAGSSLVIDLPPAATAAHALLACRQIHYANLGGPRAIAPRRAKLRVGAQADGSWTWSAWLLVDLRGVASDLPPLIRFDAISVPLGGAAAWRPLAWYDGRQAVADLTWRITTLPANIAIGAGSAAAPTAIDLSAPQPAELFVREDLRLRSTHPAGRVVCTIAIGDGTAERDCAFDIDVAATAGDLAVVGDLPLAIDRPTTVLLTASRSDAALHAITPHPTTGRADALAVQAASGVLSVTIDPAGHPGLDELSGCAVFTSGGGSTYRMPYRIRLLRRDPG